MHTTDPELELIDYEQLEPFIEVGLEDFREILHDVIEETPVRLKEIHGLLLEGEVEAAKRILHSLRGMLSNFGCQLLCSRLFILEHGSPISAAEIPARFQELQTLWTLSLGAILEWEKSVEA